MKKVPPSTSVKKSRLRHGWRIFLWITLGVVVLSLFSPLWNPFVFPEVKNPQYGVSFSIKQARNLGVDWRANFTALLDDMGVKNFRLMSYWDETEGMRGQFTFSDLDWQLHEAAKRGATVTLSVGLRQPRWPECHQPSWADNLGGNQWKQALYAFMEQVVKRYEHNPTVMSWQLENEGANGWFGQCQATDETRLHEEFTLMKKWSKKPVWMSLSDQHSLPLMEPVPDKYGYSVYRIVWNEKIPPIKEIYMIYPTPIWYHRLRQVALKVFWNRDIFIHELQLEPWGPEDTKYLSVAEQNKSMSTRQIGKSLKFAREIGSDHIYTWGGEWWYWRKVHGDPSVWNTVKAEFNKTEQRAIYF